MSQPSNLNAQQLIDYARVFSWTTPIVGVSGYSTEPAVSFLDDIVKKILAKSNPWKWNEIKAPIFYTQPYQQDYPTSISQSVMGWLSACTMVDVNDAITEQPPIQPPVNCVARLQPSSALGNPSKICWITNAMAITGQTSGPFAGLQWPGPGIQYINPLTSQGGGPSNNPNTAITDLNGNIQVV